MQQNSNHVFTGLQQDTSVSKCKSQYLIDAHNIRITAREGETLLSVTNEKGPKELVLKDEIGDNIAIPGEILGHCVLNNYLVLFVHNGSNGDKIFRIDMTETNPKVISLFNDTEGTGSLGFDPDFPIEAIGDYENENIQKVYWTDGLNQPRVINIANQPSGSPKIYTWGGAFDFTPELRLEEKVNVTKNTNTSGMFPAGVIQYAFTYYNKYGQETNIFATTPLHYISFYDRGGSPESKIANAFSISVANLDKHFDYLRIYSIMRTSLNGTPVVKRLQDIEIGKLTTATYTDTGANGDDVDPTHLLFVGGEHIVAETICSKDGTLFLGGLKIKRPTITPEIKSALQDSANHSTISTTRMPVVLTIVSPPSGVYPYMNGLNTQAAGFKNREYYRLGIQFQYKNGKWSEPCWIKDYQINSFIGPTQGSGGIYKLVVDYPVPHSILDAARALGYKKYRPLVVFPEMQDRTIIAQGVVNPVMSTHQDAFVNNSLQGQSSWFFRPIQPVGYSTVTAAKAVAPIYRDELPYVSSGTDWNMSDADFLRHVEIQGFFGIGNYATSPNKFYVNWEMKTFHSPEITFDDHLTNMDFTGVKCSEVGYADFIQTLSDIDIQTSTPTVSNSGSGFIHKSFVTSGAQGIVSGLFYDDFVVDDNSNEDLRGYASEHNSVEWMIYPWQQSGSLNNDFNRPAGKGTRSAVLSKKVISNLRYAVTTWRSNIGGNILSYTNKPVPQLFSSDQLTAIKTGDKVYQGNVDTVLIPESSDGKYFAYDADDITNRATINTPFISTSWWKTHSPDPESTNSAGLYRRRLSDPYIWDIKNDDIGDNYVELVRNKESIRMKYKSTPHIIMYTGSNTVPFKEPAYINSHAYLPIVELYRDYNEATAFGGKSLDALKANQWLPAGEAVPLDHDWVTYEWGDTWFSRYDCLKTYPFTKEDPNQIVEIGSFMLETHINIDGRYDRNRGQVNNLNMSPQNFNLYNPVYSQRDNFFSYRILDTSYYELNDFPNQVTWSTEKRAGADVDPWTSVTLASTYDMDGAKGRVHALTVWNGNIYCFQDKGVSNILFNSRVQIPTSDNVPIEITNNYKVDGKRYISDGIGCINKWAICGTHSGIYFIDSVSKHLYNIDGNGIMDVSTTKNMTSWFKGLDNLKWTVTRFTTRMFYDSCHSDLYIVTEDECLCFNEIIGEFTSYMSYHDIPIMFNILDKFYSIKSNYIYEMFAGDYGYFFRQYEPYDLTFVENGIDQNMVNVDKIFTNMEFFADRWFDDFGRVALSSESPFDYVRLWNEYQDTGEVLLRDIKDRPSNLKKKFRTWRISIPRDAHNRRDRIRNTWCKVKIGSAPRYRDGNNGAVELHNLNVIYHT